MRISFDLDDTLIPAFPGQFPIERNLRARIAALVVGEPLREGAIRLLLTLQALGHEVVIYTTSLRSPRSIRWMFWLAGVRVQHAYNLQSHQSLRIATKTGVSKHPPSFGIDIHIDDSPGVENEGHHYGFPVIVVRPEESGWVEQVINSVATASSSDKGILGPWCSGKLSNT